MAGFLLKIGQSQNFKSFNQVVETLEEASRVYCKLRDESDEGSSTFPEGRLYDTSGEQIAYVSYNGRVWSGSKHDLDATPIYSPW
jgi:hypothetical protein